MTVHVTISPATLSTSGPTTLTVSGTGFQSIQGGFGGIYVLFGTADGQWRPSQGGVSGLDYAYIPDSQTAANHGYIRFVSFPGDPTAAQANGGTLAADGHWSTTLVVPGPVIATLGRDGKTHSVDCSRTACGVLTIGAHGVVNPENESFTRVAVRDASSSAPVVAGSVGGGLLVLVAAGLVVALRRRRQPLGATA